VWLLAFAECASRCLASPVVTLRTVAAILAARGTRYRREVIRGPVAGATRRARWQVTSPSGRHLQGGPAGGPADLALTEKAGRRAVRSRDTRQAGRAG